MPMIQTDSKHYTDIANAIRAKNGLLAQYYPEDMAGAIGALPVEDSSMADIFNHGSITGINPYYKFQQGSTSGLTINNQTITLSKSYAYANLIIDTLIDKRKYSKICIDCEVPNTSDNYKDVVFGARAYSRGIPSQNYESGMPSPYIQLVGWYSRQNYSGTSPWYALPRVTIRLDVSSLSENLYYVELYRHYGDLIIYSLWLEP